MAEACCKRPTPRIWRNVMRQAKDPWRSTSAVAASDQTDEVGRSDSPMSPDLACRISIRHQTDHLEHSPLGAHIRAVRTVRCICNLRRCGGVADVAVARAAG